MAVPIMNTPAAKITGAAFTASLAQNSRSMAILGKPAQDDGRESSNYQGGQRYNVFQIARLIVHMTKTIACTSESELLGLLRNVGEHLPRLATSVRVGRNFIPAREQLVFVGVGDPGTIFDWDKISDEIQMLFHAFECIL